MIKKFTYNKIKNKIIMTIVLKTRNFFFYPMLYKSWWNFYLKKESIKSIVTHKNYLCSIPNQRAGIGHQLGNWIAGYWFSKKFELNFTYASFSNKEWNDFLGFGENIIKLEELLDQGYKKVILPLFEENNKNEIKLVKNIIESYQNQKVVFVTEQDQFYFNQYDVIEDIQKLFYNSKFRKNERLIFEENFFNIAIHIRRGDITAGQLNKNPNLLMRWQDNDYFINVLDNVSSTLKVQKKIKIYLFSQGKKEDYPEFHKYDNVIYCLDMNAKDSFLHMVYADLLITSKSSFSYKPALLSKGIKISPENFWHGYPNKENWIIADEKGNFKKSILIKNILKIDN